MSVAKRRRAMLDRMFREQFAHRVNEPDKALYALQQAFRNVPGNIPLEEFQRRAREAVMPYLKFEVERG